MYISRDIFKHLDSKILTKTLLTTRSKIALVVLTPCWNPYSLLVKILLAVRLYSQSALQTFLK